MQLLRFWAPISVIFHVTDDTKIKGELTNNIWKLFDDVLSDNFFHTFDLPNCMAPVPSTNISIQCPYYTNIVHLQKKKKFRKTTNAINLTHAHTHTHITYTTATKNWWTWENCAFHFPLIPSNILPSKCHVQRSGWNKKGWNESMG